VAKLQDISRREFLILGSLAAVVLLFGIWPAPLLEVMHPTIEHLVAHLTQSKVI
jgi:NADH-quinone oxidoreductase subunit M